MINLRNRRPNRTHPGTRLGTTTVEVAICLPVLFIFLFGCYEVARANMIIHAAESAAYEAARTGIVPGTTQEQIEDSAAFVLRSVGVSNFTVNVTPGTIVNSTEKVKVKVTIPLRTNTVLTSLFVKDPVFVGECELKRESF